MTLIPAYGRDYKSKKEVLADWEAGKDFQIAITRQYCSNRDIAFMKETGVTSLSIRYSKLTKQMIINL